MGEKSDEVVVLRKRPNKGRQLLAEVVEGRASPKGNSRQEAGVRTLSRVTTLLTHRAPPSGQTSAGTRFEAACDPAYSRQSDRRAATIRRVRSWSGNWFSEPLFPSVFSCDNGPVHRRESLNSSLAKAGFRHPVDAFRAAVLGTADGVDQHVEARKQAVGMNPTLIIDEAVVDNERAARVEGPDEPFSGAASWLEDPNRAGYAP